MHGPFDLSILFFRLLIFLTIISFALEILYLIAPICVYMFSFMCKLYVFVLIVACLVDSNTCSPTLQVFQTGIG